MNRNDLGSPLWNYNTRNHMDNLRNPQSRLKAAIQAARTKHAMPLSDCSLQYMAALYDPRGVYEAPNVPNQAVYSEKNKVYARGTMATGTTGVGFIVARLNGAGDTWCVTNTLAGSVGGIATTLNAFTGSTTSNSNSRYTAAQFGNTATTIKWRPVGAALYIKYAGTELNRGGDYVILEEPNHADLLANYTYTSMLSQDGAKRVPVDNEWHHICYVPNDDTEAAYSATNTANGGNATIGIAILSAANAQNFEFEFHMWYEAVGSIARSATQSYNDPIGYGCITGAATMYQQLDDVLGLDGFVEAIHSQMRNLSGVMIPGGQHGNWTGLLAFLPSLAKAAGVAALKAGKKQLLREVGIHRNSHK